MGYTQPQCRVMRMCSTPRMNVNQNTGAGAPEIMDKPGAAAFLCAKPRTIDEWMKNGYLPYSKLPSGAVRFRRDQLLEFVSKFEVNARRR